MIITQRQQAILDSLDDTGLMRISQLAKNLNVSLETIRRDIKPLADAGRLIKQHGNVCSNRDSGEVSFERRIRENTAAKLAIAHNVASMIADGDSVMMDTGTTTSALARQLLTKRNLTIVTNSSDIARILATVNGNKVYMAGGELDGDNGAAFGRSAIEFIAGFRVDHAIISIAGIDTDMGLMDYQLTEAEFANRVLRCGRQRLVITDHSKFNRTALVQVAGFNDFDILVTDQSPPPEIHDRLEQSNIDIIIAHP